MSLDYSNVFFAFICLLCALIMGALALWAFKRKDPMHFWAGSAVKPEEITDIPAYNRANGLMWAVYAACLVMTAVVALLNVTVATVLLLIICIPGILVLIIAYRRIYNKYRRTS